MIYLNEGYMELESLPIERCFIKRGEDYYFIVEGIRDTEYLAVKIHPTHERRFGLEVVILYTKGENEEFEGEDIVKDKKERERAIHEFFYYLSYEESSQNVSFYEGIFKFIKDYIGDAYFYSEEASLCGDFMELFKLIGHVTIGNYAGNLILTDIRLINKVTGEIIKKFEQVNIEGNLFIEEEDEDEDYIIEAYLDSMTEDNIRDKFTKAIE